MLAAKNERKASQYEIKKKSLYSKWMFLYNPEGYIIDCVHESDTKGLARLEAKRMLFEHALQDYHS